MTVKVRIPTALRAYANGASVVEVANVHTAQSAIDHLLAAHPQLKPHLTDDSGALRSFVNVYVNQEDVRHAKGLATPVKSGDTILIVPAVAGGNGLSRKEVAQYSRHLIMPEVGLAGQERLKNAKVLMVGTGGLGAPAALYLAAAGVGRIGLVDFDRVDASNLQRQVLFSAADVGKPKVEAARARLEGLNPHISIDAHDTQFTSANAHDLLRDYDILVDGTDNFPTRYLSNDVAVMQGKPNVYASIFRFEGQASVFGAPGGPCYRCLYARPPPPGLVPSCAEGGVLGVLPGIMGSIQAVETIKLILGKGDSLAGRLLLFDALAMEFTELKLRKNPDCPVCGEEPSITELIDYEEFCGIRGEEAPVAAGTPTVAPRALAAELAGSNPPFLLDTREPHEWDIVHLKGAKLIPPGELAARVSEVPLNEDVVVYCLSGARSGRAVDFLRSLGYKRVRNLTGGIRAWADEVDPTMPRY
ncbi:MAG: ubiquitin-like small modifier protein 1 [Thermoplasmatota archaeon]